MKSPECAACGGEMQPFYRTAFPGQPWMQRCAACAFCMVSPLPASFGGEYEDAYTASAEAERKNRRLAPDYLRKIRAHLPPAPFRLLEVGGAHGWLAQLVRDTCGADALLLEPGRTAVARAQGRGLAARCGWIEGFAAEHSFDVVCAAHVIEHVARVESFLVACHRVLRPGGTLLLLTPNASAWKLACFRDRWAWAVPEQHTHLLSADAATRLLAKGGFAPMMMRGMRPAFAHYPFFLARALAEWRARHGAAWLRWFTRPLALAEFALLAGVDALYGSARADELLIVARKI
jgi:SAM-dependent methyltransferase